MKISFLGVFILLMVTSCETDTEGYISLSDRLLIDATKENGMVKVKWTLTNKMSDFTEYQLYRSKDKDFNHSELVYSSTDFYNNTWVDINPYGLGVNYYRIEAVGSEGHRRHWMKSNIDSVRVGDYTSYSFFPKSVIFDKETNLLGFIDERSYFTLYNYETGKTITSIKVSSSFLYPCFGKNNGHTELYLVGEGESGISVYDVSSMKKVKHIITTNSDIYSIATNNKGKVYISSNYNGTIEVLNRNNSYRYNISSYYDNKYLKYSQKNNALMVNAEDGRLYKYPVDANGDIDYYNSSSYYLYGTQYICFKEDHFNGDIYVMPNGNMLLNGYHDFISNVYSNSQDVAFGANHVYMAPLNQKHIQKSGRTSSTTETINTAGYPVYVFVDDAKLIVLFVDDIMQNSISSYNYVYKGYQADTAFGIAVIQ